MLKIYVVDFDDTFYDDRDLNEHSKISWAHKKWFNYKKNIKIGNKFFWKNSKLYCHNFKSRQI